MKPLQLLLAVPLLAAPAAAQQFDVVINEVLYDPAGPDAGLERIELLNRDTQEADLAGWSLAVCYPGTLQDNRSYWPCAPGMKIPPGGIVTIHYLADGLHTHTDYYTGASGVQFLCVTPPKHLDNGVGSVALYDTTTCSLFSSSTSMIDFVQWGGSTHHEVQAQAAGMWPAGTWFPDVPEGHSLAYVGEGDGPEVWWEDASPTLGLPNVSPGSGFLAEYGAGCAGTTGIPHLNSVGGPPAMGNQSFHLRIQGALPSAPAVVAMAASPGALPLFGCIVEIDLALYLLDLGPELVDGSGDALFPLPVPTDLTLLGVPLYFQGAVVDAGAPGGVVAFSTALQAVM